MDFDKELEKFNISLSSEMKEKFERYYCRLIDVNSYMNLTAITEHDDVFIKHFLDSLSLSLVYDFNNNIKLCDVGSGAGFPSIPLAIIFPNIDVTIIDALNKRINFLNDLSKLLNLEKVIALHKRAEEYASEKREAFDIVTARAVARLNILSELCLPLVRVGGYFIAMKGQSAKEEIDEAANAISKLGGKIVEIKELELPCEMGHREIVLIKKISNTLEKYPRSFAKIKEKPL